MTLILQQQKNENLILFWSVVVCSGVLELTKVDVLSLVNYTE